MSPPVTITCVLSMRGCEAFNKGVARAIEPQSFLPPPCVKEEQELLDSITICLGAYHLLV